MDSSTPAAPPPMPKGPPLAPKDHAEAVPSRTAAMLARLPRVPFLRAQLRRLATAAEPRQVPLL
jgi:hypothetical protein